MPSTQAPASPKKPRAPKPSEVAKAMTPATPEDFQPIDFWNPVYPNEHIFVHIDGYAAEYAQDIHFAAGFFRANEKWQADAILDACAGRVYTADTNSQLRCDKCGWMTKSTAAFSYHIQQHA
jgi:hypothetical protein